MSTPLKKIVFPWVSVGGFGDSFALTAIAKQSDLTIQIKQSESFAEHWRVFEGLAKVEFIRDEEFPVDGETLAIRTYGNPDRKSATADHYIANLLYRFGLNYLDCLPVVKFTELDVQWANHFVRSLKKPICFCPMPGGRPFACPLACAKMQTLEEWEKLLKLLRPHHDILYITEPQNYFPIEGVIPILGQPLRRICSLFYVTGRHLGIENGLLHAAIASGATTRAFVQGFGQNPGYLFPNYAYTKEMFDYVGQPQRAFYYKFNEVNRFIKEASKPIN